jgi:hypothetical protein
VAVRPVTGPRRFVGFHQVLGVALLMALIYVFVYPVADRIFN